LVSSVLKSCNRKVGLALILGENETDRLGVVVALLLLVLVLERKDDDVHILAPLGKGEREDVVDASEDTDDEVEAEDDGTMARLFSDG
jgi:hypothetical protein